MSTEQAVRGSHNPPYVSFKAFEALVADFALRGTPALVDRSCFRIFSDAVRAQLVAALRFLGLIDVEGRPTPDLQALARSHGSDGFAAELGRILAAR
jgi:hypothetical protein